jgi:hypothetical protein
MFRMCDLVPPGSGPRRGVAERPRVLLRPRATHDRSFDPWNDPKRSVRGRPGDFRAARRRIRPLVAKCIPRPVNQTRSTDTGIS